MEKCDSCNRIIKECYYVECFGAWLIYCKECYDNLDNSKSDSKKVSRTRQ